MFFLNRYDHPDRNSDTLSASSNSRQNSIVASQLYALRTAVNHLRSAYQGNDVEWTDQGTIFRKITLIL